MVPFAINSGDVVEIVLVFRKFDQQITNKFDILAAGAAFTSNDLLTQIGTDWSTQFATKISNDAFFAQARAQKVTDVVAGGGGPNPYPRRIRTSLDLFTPTTSGNTFTDGSAITPHLPVDVTVSINLQTAGPPSLNWGRKSHGPLPQATVGGDGEVMAGAGWQTAATNFYVGTHAVGATGGTYRVVVVPATQIMRLAGVHPAIGTLVNNVLGANVGTYVGSQETRRLNPNSTRGH